MTAKTRRGLKKKDGGEGRSTTGGVKTLIRP